MRILILSSYTKSLLCFRLEMMQEFMRRGCEVIAVGEGAEKGWSESFEKLGIRYDNIFVKRNGLNPFDDFRTLKEIRSIIRKYRPDKIFVYQAKTIVYGCWAAHSEGISEVYPLVAGLGSMVHGSSIKARIIRPILLRLYRMAFRYSSKVFFHNKDDRNFLTEKKIADREKTVVVNGSGVNLEHLQPTKLPACVAFIYIGRLIRDKGILEYLEACRELKKRHPDVRCLLVGPFDTNPSAIKKKQLQPFISSGAVEYFGEQEDVRPYIAQASVCVCPSYNYEGLPKSVCEAMAMGRAVIASDAPGCRETVVDGENGFLVPIGNAAAIVEKMEYMVQHPELIKVMGAKSRKIAEERFEVNKVNVAIMRAMYIL